MATDARPLEDLSDTGLLWLINTVVLHPRGYALALHYEGSKAVGWSIMGDGTEVWRYQPKDDEHPDGVDLDAKFAAVEALLAEARAAGG